jgi:hypothetical protein
MVSGEEKREEKREYVMYLAFLGNTDVFEVLSCIVTLIITLRAIWLYTQLRGFRLLVLGLAMALFSLTTIAGIVHNVRLLPGPFNTTWFSFAGQTGAFLFIFFSAIRGTDDYLRRLVRWQIILSVLIFLLLPLAPVLPNVSSILLKALFIGARGLVCLLICYCYVLLFIKKETRFGLFMMVAFFLLACGYIAIIPRFYLPHVDILTLVGDILRVIGLALFAFALLGA